MDDSHDRKTVYKETIVRFKNWETFNARTWQYQKAHGNTLLDTWENDIGNCYARYCWTVDDEIRTYNAYGIRFGRRYKCNNQKFKEYLTRTLSPSKYTQRDIRTYFKKVFAYVTKQELIVYFNFLHDAINDYLGAEEMVAFEEFLKDYPIEDDKRFFIEDES